MDNYRNKSGYMGIGLRPELDDSAYNKNVKFAAEFLGVSQAAIRRWVFDRRIPFKKIASRLIRFSVRDLNAWVDGR